MKREPLLTVGGIVALVTATIGLLVAFGVDISQDQQVAILEVVAVAAPVAVALIARHWVSSPTTVAQEQVDSFEEGAAKTEAAIALDDGNTYGDDHEGPDSYGDDTEELDDDDDDDDDDGAL